MQTESEMNSMETDSRSFIKYFTGLIRKGRTGGNRTSVEKGLAGEDIAALYLKKSGFKIIQRNFRWYGNEIDIIARDKDYIVFIEVKASSTKGYDHPLTWIPEAKQKRIIRASEGFLLSNKISVSPVRFDVLAIDSTGNISHIKDAFRA
jgi:putative endonuclease